MEIGRMRQNFYSSNINNVNVSERTEKIKKSADKPEEVDKTKDLDKIDKKKDLDKTKDIDKVDRTKDTQDTPRIDTADKTQLSQDAKEETNKVKGTGQSEVDNKIDDAKNSIQGAVQPGGQAEKDQAAAGGAAGAGAAGGAGVVGQVNKGAESGGKVSEIAAGGGLVNNLESLKGGNKVEKLKGAGDIDNKVSALKENVKGQNANKANDIDEKVNSLKKSLNKFGGVEGAKDKKVQGLQGDEKGETKEASKDKSVSEKEKVGSEEKKEINQVDKTKDVDKAKDVEKSKDIQTDNKSEEANKAIDPGNAQVSQDGGKEKIEAQNKVEKPGDADPQREQQKMEMFMKRFVQLQGVTDIEKAAEQAGIGKNKISEGNINEVAGVARRDMQALLKPDKVYGASQHNERIGKKVEDGVKKKLQDYIAGGKVQTGDELKKGGLGQE